MPTTQIKSLRIVQVFLFFIFSKVFGIGRKNTIKLIILRLKFVNLKGFEMRESYEDYLIGVLVLFVRVPKLRQCAEVKAPRILQRKGFSLFQEIAC